MVPDEEVMLFERVLERHPDLAAAARSRPGVARRWPRRPSSPPSSHANRQAVDFTRAPSSVERRNEQRGVGLAASRLLPGDRGIAAVRGGAARATRRCAGRGRLGSDGTDPRFQGCSTCSHTCECEASRFETTSARRSSLRVSSSKRVRAAAGHCCLYSTYSITTVPRGLGLGGLVVRGG